MRFRGSLATRVALLTTVAVGLVVALLSTAAFLTVQHQLHASLDASLVKRASAAAESPALSRLTRIDVPTWWLGAADLRLAILASDGTFIDGGSQVGGSLQLTNAELAVARGESRQSLRTAFAFNGRYRVCAVPGNEPGTALVIAQSLEPTRSTLATLSFVLAIFSLVGVVVAGLVGRAVASNGLKPVRKLTRAVEGIAETERLDPIEVDGEDEIARLAAAFNTTLAALSASRSRQARLVADAGHELRTPLTSLRTNIELLAQADGRGGLSATQRAELMSDVKFQIDELTSLIRDLTELAREEPASETFEIVDLAEVTERALDRVKRRASSLHFDVELEPWHLLGVAASLERAVTNVLDNAAKWSPPLGVVTVRLRDGVLNVSDQGSGIAETDLPHVFERFYRSDESRTMPGSGLGLSIVSHVMESHGGLVKAGSSPSGGASFWLKFPTCDEAADSTETAQPRLRADSAKAGKVDS